MTEFFGFDPKKMSDDELVTKQQMIMGKLAWAGRFSGNPDIIGQLQKMSNAITQERIDRINRRHFDQLMKMFPDVIETDPVLANEQAQQEAAAAEQAKPARQRQHAPVKRTSKPVVPETRPITESKKEDK